MTNFQTISHKDFLANYFGEGPRGSSPWYQIHNKIRETEISIFDFIGKGGVEAKVLVEEISQLKGRDLTVRINSPGGDVFDGLAIFNSLKRHEGGVSVIVDGVAASIASLIAMSGDTISMSQGSMLMIHDAWALTIGNAQDHIDMSGTLDKVSNEMATIYGARAGITTKVVRDIMKKETWLTSEEAKGLGFADSIDENGNRQAKARTFTVPQGFLKKAKMRLELAKREELTTPPTNQDRRARMRMKLELSKRAT